MRALVQSNRRKICNARFYAGQLRAFARILPGLLALSLAPIPAVALAEDTAAPNTFESPSDRPASCNLYLELARSAVPSRERSYALRALRECAPSPVIARVLETAVAGDDFAARTAALASLDRHLDRQSVPVLLTVLEQETPHSRHPERVVQVYRYLSRLAGSLQHAAHSENSKPAAQAVPADLFVEGLDHADVRIREASLLGLGRTGLADPAWPLLYRTLLAPRSVRDHVAALRASRILSTRSDPQALRAAGTTLELLRRHHGRRADDRRTVPADPALLAAYASASQHELAQAERAALELLGDLRGPRALEQLLLYRLRAGRGLSGGPANSDASIENHDRLQGLINARLRGLSKTLGQPARSLRSLRVYARPTESSSVLGALAENSIVYIADATTLGYRLPPLRGAAGPEANWLRVSTLRGLTGWVHASRIQRIAVPNQ